MIGSNGGLIGRPRLPNIAKAPGFWTLEEQSVAIRQASWPAYRQPDTVSSLLLYYDGPNYGTEVFDSSILQNTITRTLGGNIVTDRSKERSSSYYVNTTGAKLKGSSTVTIAGDFMWQCWWYPELYQAGYKALFGLEGSSSWQLSINDDGNRPLFFMQHRPGFSIILDGSSGGAIPLNQWNHVALTRSGSNLRMWLNGALRASTTYTGTMTGIPVANEWLTGTPYLGYIDLLQMVNGAAVYTGNFTLPTAAFPDVGTGGDAYFASTSVLLHMDGSNSSTTFTDSSSNAIAVTPSGNAQISTAQSKFGGASALFDGTGDFLATASNPSVALGTGDFTIEMWVRSTGGSGYRTFAGNRPDAGNHADGVSLGLGPSNELYLYSNGFIATSAASLILLNTWHHVAATRYGTTVRLFIDGVSLATGSNSQNLSRQILAVGATLNGDQAFPGYIDDLRVTKGVARYTANFTPPTAAFPEAGTGEGDQAFAYNSLLLHMDGTNGSTTFTDSSSSSLTVTPSGNAQISTAQSKFGGASGLFDGTGDYLEVNSNTSFDLSGDFTIELWVRPAASAVNTGLIVRRVLDTTGTGTWGLQINNGTATFSNLQTSTNTTFGTVPLDTWTHIAVTRISSSIRLFLNGSFNAVVADSINFTNTQKLFVGAWSGTGGVPNAGFFNGYIDDLRITNGFARYTGNFTPPIVPYTG